MLKATFKSALAHKLRFALTTLAVTLGVTFVAGTTVFTDTLNRVFETMVDEGSAGVDVYVRAQTEFQSLNDYGTGGPGIPETLLADVTAVEGVAAAEGGVQGYAQFVGKDGEAITPMGPPTLGLSWTEDEGLSALAITDGRAPTGPGQVAMDVVTAERHGFEVGDRVDVLLQGPKREFDLVGTFGWKGASSFGGATIAAFDLGIAQVILGKAGTLDQIEVAADEGISANELRRRLAEPLPSDVEVITATDQAAEQKQQIREGFGFFTTVLLVFAGIAVFVGAFIIFNTFSIIVAQRLREFGLLRAIGASQRQIMTSVVAEAILIAVLASAAGIVLGLGAAVGLQGMLEAFGLDLPSTSLVLTSGTIMVAFAVGIGVTVTSALLPARRASRIPAIAAMQDVRSDGGDIDRRRVFVGGAASVAGVSLMAAGLLSIFSEQIAAVGAGALLVFIGIATLSPLFARRLAGAIGAPLPRLFGVTGKLARENSTRSPRRTAATAAALMVGLALVTLVAMFSSSLKASVDTALDRTMKADLIVMPPSMMSMTGFSPEVARRLERLDEVGVVSRFRFGEWEGADGNRRFLLAVDPATVAQVMELEMISGSVSDLEDGGVLVRRVEADNLGIAAGDTLVMTFGNTGAQRVPVAGVFDAVMDDRYLLSMKTYESNFGRRDDIQVHLTLVPGMPLEQAEAAVDQALAPFPNVQVLNQAAFRAESSELIDQMLNMVFALLALALIIAILGIANTLALSVFERKRELGLLRAVGATKAQVRKMIRWESAVIALFGTVLGVVIGIAFGWALISALSDEGFSQIVIPVPHIAVFVVVAGVAGLLAAVLPARRAARVDVLEAIAFE